MFKNNSWGIFSTVDANSRKIPGYRAKAYRNTYAIAVNDTNEHPDRYSFILVIYTGEKDTLFELKYRKGYFYKHEDVRPVDAAILEILFNAVEEDSVLKDILENKSIVNIDGRTFIKANYSRRFTVYDIKDTFIGNLFARNGKELALLLKYHDRVKTHKDARRVLEAMSMVDDVLYEIEYNSLDDDKKRMIDDIKHIQEELEKTNLKSTTICEDAAEAMNELSSVFGLDLVLDE